MVYDTTIAIPENPLLLTSQNYYYNIKHDVSLSNSRQHTDFSNKLQTKTYTQGKSKYPLQLINLKWAGHYYGMLMLDLSFYSKKSEVKVLKYLFGALSSPRLLISN